MPICILLRRLAYKLFVVKCIEEFEVISNEKDCVDLGDDSILQIGLRVPGHLAGLMPWVTTV